MRHESGQATVELLLVILIHVLVIFTAFELGRGVLLKHALDVGTEKAARVLSINPADYAAAVEMIRAEVDANLLGGNAGARVTVRLYDEFLRPITAAELATAPFGYRFWISAELPWQADAPLVALRGRLLSAAHQGVVDRIP